MAPRPVGSMRSASPGAVLPIPRPDVVVATIARDPARQPFARRRLTGCPKPLPASRGAPIRRSSPPPARTAPVPGAWPSPGGAALARPSRSASPAGQRAIDRSVTAEASLRAAAAEPARSSAGMVRREGFPGAQGTRPCASCGARVLSGGACARTSPIRPRPPWNGITTGSGRFTRPSPPPFETGPATAIRMAPSTPATPVRTAR